MLYWFCGVAVRNVPVNTDYHNEWLPSNVRADSYGYFFHVSRQQSLAFTKIGNSLDQSDKKRTSACNVFVS